MDYLQIPASNLRVGMLIHLRGVDFRCVWKVVRIDGEKMHLETPKTKKPSVEPIARACYTRKNVPHEALNGRR